MKKKESHFIWPKVSYRWYDFFGKGSEEEIESTLKEMFPSGFPVVCSSGRVALQIALTEKKLKRSDSINLFPYASHCVISAVSRVTNPTPFLYSNDSNPNLVYHQWGYDSVEQNKVLIEDSVDSLYEKNTPLFYSKSDYEIWSLNKILGTTSGAILWCKNQIDAERIKRKLIKDNSVIFSWVLRILSNKYLKLYKYWEGTEINYKGISKYQAKEIYKKILTWDSIVLDRKNKINLILKNSELTFQKPKGRLPNVILINSSISEKKLNEIGFSVGYRHFYNGIKMNKVYPLPIHQDVPLSKINKAIQLNENV